jgi:SEC-C motif
MTTRDRLRRTGRNDPCPCGSGRKYKRCCLGRERAGSYTQEERASALAKLKTFVAEELGPEEDAAWLSFFERWQGRLDELDADEEEVSDALYDMWFCLDFPLEVGRHPVDVFLEARPPLTDGERRYLQLLRETVLRLYEVADAVPGVSLSLRDVVTGVPVEVRERLGSRSIPRHTLLAARVIASGASGGPEMERGVVAIPELVRRSVLEQHEKQREAWRREHPGAPEAEFDRTTPPFVNDVWMACRLEPPVPRLKNTDGEDLLLTRVRFEALDPARLEGALDTHGELQREDEGRRAWFWSGRNARGDEVSLGRIVLEGSELLLECNSAARSERGRALIEALDAGGITQRTTTHENIAAAVREGLRDRGARESIERPPDIPREVQEALVLDHLARHYRGWLDEKIPALDDHTPREAARDAALRPKLIGLIEGLEGTYQRALQSGAPAYDPSWMWDELELDVRRRPPYPPPLAHERLAEAGPGLAELCAAVAAAVRQRPGFDASTVLTASELAANLQVQAFLRAAAREAATGLADQVRCLVNYDLHHRKTFWVDEPLAYMLAKTDPAVPGRDLHVPFASFALVFTDRHLLSLGERLLSLEGRSPLKGHFLQVVTIYVTDEPRAGGRVLRLVLALDALGADPPYLAMHEVPLAEDVPVQQYLEGVTPPVVTEPPVADWHPLRGLLQVAINAILYATSAGVAPESRQSPAGARRRDPRRGSEAPLFSSETVFFLPGAIEISQLRKLQELERAPSGRGLLHRFMVRGHWRRVPTGWKDQRMRWIEPYWKGPDLAAIVERTYKLTHKLTP